MTLDLSKLQKALEKIGRTNGHAPPESQDPLDAVQHEYLVATTSEKVFKKRREAALKEVRTAISMNVEAAEMLEKAIKETIQYSQGGAYELLSSQHYALSLQTRKPIVKLDEAKLRVNLARRGMSAAQIEELFRESYTTLAPAQSFVCSVR